MIPKEYMALVLPAFDLYMYACAACFFSLSIFIAPSWSVGHAFQLPSSSVGQVVSSGFLFAVEQA